LIDCTRVQVVEFLSRAGRALCQAAENSKLQHKTAKSRRNLATIPLEKQTYFDWGWLWLAISTASWPIFAYKKSFFLVILLQ
jgi:hypothetical protein